MRAYADSSFILRLLIREVDSPAIIAAYRRLELPNLFFLPLHALEVKNAILQRAFFQRSSGGAAERKQIARERDAALSRLQHLIRRRALVEVNLDMDIAFSRAVSLSDAHTERLDARAIDLLHVASALTLECEVFLTTDHRQVQLAKAEGLRVPALA